MHRTHPPTRSSTAKIGKTRCTDVISSAVWFTNTGELHEHIYAPHRMIKQGRQFDEPGRVEHKIQRPMLSTEDSRFT
jgi:hypothetical protein